MPTDTDKPWHDPHGVPIPPFGTKETCSALTGHSKSTIERNIAADPELGRRTGKYLLVNIWRYLAMLDQSPRAQLAAEPDRLGMFARRARMENTTTAA